MSKGASSPAAPNPYQTAQAQTGSNIGTAVANSTLNNTNQVTPFGSTTYSQSGGYTDPTSGQFVPQFTQTNSLSPQEQGILDKTLGLQGQQLDSQGQLLGPQTELGLGQLGLQNSLLPGEQNIAQGAQGVSQSLLPLAGNLANQASSSATTPLNFNSTNNSIVQGGPQALSGQTANAIYNEQAGFLDPQFQQSQQNMNDQLSRQGIPVGSPAWNDAMTQFNNSKNQAYSAAGNNAIAQSIPAAASMFGMALQGQNQNVTQQQLAQQQPLNLLSQLYGSGAL